MGKAITGAVEIVGAIGMGAALFFDPALAFVPGYVQGMWALGMAGIASEAGAIAEALSSNRSNDITIRQPASPRGLVYGIRRVGGVLIYNRTTGSKSSYLNQVIVLATHECYAIENLYLDGRLVHFDGNSIGHTIRNGYAFGGTADGGTYTGPDGQQYNFGGKVYCEAKFGDQLPGDVIGGLTANSPEWKTTADGSPYVGGCTYVYLKIEADAASFPGKPEVKFTVHGKQVYDPRTGVTTFSANPALIINDIITDSKYGLGDDTVNQDQLIAAANVCDEEVEFLGAGGGVEARYSCHWMYDTTTGPGDAVAQMMKSMGGRLSRIGGEWYIWPAYYQGPTASFDESVLVAQFEGTSTAYRDLCNRVTGTYCAPKFPFNIAGNYYDANGFNNGSIQNNFGYGYEQTNFPQYAEDQPHGYASDQYLNEDGGIQRPMELGLPCVLSVGQAQRLAKIELLRNRKQRQKWTFQMSLAAYQLQEADTFYMTLAQNGWQNKLMDVIGTQFVLDAGDGSDTPPEIKFFVTAQETSEDIYTWNGQAGDEQTIYARPASTNLLSNYTVAPPTSLAVTSGAGTALQQPDGSVLPRLQVDWDTPQDGLVSRIQLQHQVVGSTDWIDNPQVDVSQNTTFLSPIVAGATYNVRARSVRNNGGVSTWTTVNGTAAGFILSTTTQDGIGRGSLIGEAFSDTDGGIECQPFTALLGNRSVDYFPSGPVFLTGQVPKNLYWVYVDDPNGTGGDLTPAATQNQGDYLGVLGRYLIDSVVTPAYSSTGGGTGSTGATYYPSSFQDLGTRSSQSASSAYDGNTASFATVSGQAVGPADSATETYGDCLFEDFPAIAAANAATLNVDASVSTTGGGNSAAINATIGGTLTNLLSADATTTRQTYTLAIPAGTDLSTIGVEVYANSEAVPGVGGSIRTVRVQVYEISIS